MLAPEILKMKINDELPGDIKGKRIAPSLRKWGE
jgi:hypothetical protein